MMKNREPLIENGVVVGTHGGKYESQNPIARLMLREFDQSVQTLVRKTSPASITEVGCGEGHVTEILTKETNAPIKAFDISDFILNEAKERLKNDRVTFGKMSIYDLSEKANTSDLVVCCEVLEHLEEPEKGLDRLAAITKEYCIISVPWEPVWRILNLARGAYIKDLGNSPGHIQHWTRSGFIRFVSQKFKVIDVRKPLPWTMLLCRPNDSVS